MKDLPFEDVIRVRSVNKSFVILRENKDLWIILMRRDYPFVSLDLNNHPDTFEKSPYYILYMTIFSDLNKRARFLFENYATCNKKYIREDLMIKDIIGKLVAILNFSHDTYSQQLLLSIDDMYDSCDGVFRIIIGLENDVIDCFYDGILNIEKNESSLLSGVRDYLLAMLKDYDINIKLSDDY